MRTRSRPRELTLRAAQFVSSTWNAEALTVDVVLSVGAAFERYDRRGAYDEILDLAGAAIPDRIPLLDSHQRGSLNDRLGEVTDIKRAGNQLVGVARLSRHSPMAQRIAAEIGDGAKFGVSIGYAVQKWAERTNPTTKRREKVATAFSIHEASLVAIPADPAATTRSVRKMEPDELENPQQTQMTRAQINGEIRSIARTAGLDDAWANGQIDAEANLDAVRAAALTAMQERSTPAGNIRATVAPGHDSNDPNAIRSAMSDALAHRLAPSLCRMEGRAREYSGHRVLDMIGDLAVARGERINLRDQNALIERALGGAHSTSDLPLLLSEAANKSLLARYQAAAPTYRRWAARRSFNDFRDHNFLRVGDFPAFKEANENGEVKYGTLSENRERVRAKEFNTGIIVGRWLLINDDLSALADFSSMIATRAASDENVLVYSLLTGAPVLSDTKALFHTDHGNLAAVAAAINTGSVGLGVAALRKQKSLDGLMLNITPRFLVVGPDKEVEGRQLLAAITATKASDVNPWSGTMELVVDGNITGNGWFISADPEAVPTVVYGYVAGSEGPQIRTEIDFDTRGVKVAAGLDFGCGVIDFRGLYKNSGA